MSVMNSGAGLSKVGFSYTSSSAYTNQKKPMLFKSSKYVTTKTEECHKDWEIWKKYNKNMEIKCWYYLYYEFWWLVLLHSPAYCFYDIISSISTIPYHFNKVL